MNKGQYKFQKKDFQDLGIGSAGSEQSQRYLNKDGSFNVRREGLPFWQHFSSYHALVGTTWTKFNLIVFSTYLLANCLFAGLYLLIGMEHIGGRLPSNGSGQDFFDAFFFSAQTFTTVGFGRLNPQGNLMSFVASLEALTGVLSFALATGLLYGRFSRPTARILFSKHGVIAPYQEISGFMFRIANQRDNQLIDVSAEVYLAITEVENGKNVRKFHHLNLERRNVDLFSLSWTVVHPIDDTSPIWGVTEEALRKGDAEFLILIRAFDDTFSQTVHARTSYKYFEVSVGAKFVPIIKQGKDGRSVVELDKLSDYAPAKLPEMAEVVEA